MAQRISRAKQPSRILRAVRQAHRTRAGTERLRFVLQVLYLIFQEGYSAIGGAQLQARTLRRANSSDASSLEAAAGSAGGRGSVRAAALLTHARRAAHTGPDAELIPLAEEDRVCGIIRKALKASPERNYLVLRAARLQESLNETPLRCRSPLYVTNSRTEALRCWRFYKRC